MKSFERTPHAESIDKQENRAGLQPMYICEYNKNHVSCLFFRTVDYHNNNKNIRQNLHGACGRDAFAHIRDIPL